MENVIQLLVEYGPIGIVIVAFFEATCLPVPVEVISLPIYLANPKRALLYAFLLIGVSILGSITGYWIGRLFHKALSSKLQEHAALRKLEELYRQKAVVTLITSAFMPLPYELYVLSAGIFFVPFRKFVFGCSISRVLRHLTQGVLIYCGGERLLAYTKEYTFGVAVFLILLVFVVKKVGNYCYKSK